MLSSIIHIRIGTYLPNHVIMPDHMVRRDIILCHQLHNKKAQELLPDLKFKFFPIYININIAYFYVFLLTYVLLRVIIVS